MILLDTHVLVWLRAGDSKLGARARRAVEKVHQSGGLAVSAITFWEVGMLQNAGRLKLAMGLASWRRRILDDGVTEIPVTGAIGIRATEILPAHADPADRMIVASAVVAKATLCTADGPLLDREMPITTIDATT